MARVRFDAVTKTFGAVRAVDALDLSVEDGEFLVLLGPSGCGKTTVLRMVAGLEDVTSGTLTIDDEVVNDMAPRERDIAMVFQSYALYPHLTVRKNIEFPLRTRGMQKAERDERVRAAAATLQLTEFLNRKPRQLSGGQRQRVALARAIVRQPRVYLMDEPLSNLDALLRIQMRADIVATQRELDTTTIYVTHDQTEAMTMGERIAVLHDGKLQQVGAPVELYERPCNTFVASFLGNPGMCLASGMLTAGTVFVEGVAVGRAAGPDRPLTVGARPESLSLAASGIPAAATFVEVLGADAHVLCTLPGGERWVVRQSSSSPRPRPNEPVHLEISQAPGAVHVFEATGERVEPTP